MITEDLGDVNIETIFRILVISLLDGNEFSGYELCLEIEKLTGKKPSHGKVYPFLNDLLDNGHVKETIIQSKNNQTKKLYTLSDHGLQLPFEIFKKLEYFLNKYSLSCTSCLKQIFSENKDSLRLKHQCKGCE